MLEAAGFRVRVLQRHVCCGRPLYDFGMLDKAKRYLLDSMDALAAELAAGIAHCGAGAQLRQRLPR